MLHEACFYLVVVCVVVSIILRTETTFLMSYKLFFSESGGLRAYKKYSTVSAIASAVIGVIILFLCKKT
jgi:hypothetical protein